MINCLKIFSIVAILLFISGCNSRKNYEPDKIDGQIILNHMLKSPIDSNNRYGAMLKNGSLLTKQGIIPKSILSSQKALSQNLGEQDLQFLNESGGYYIFAKGCKSVILIKTSKLDEQAFDSGVCEIKNKQSNKACTQEQIIIPMNNSCIISASIKNDLLALINSDNNAMLYRIPKGEVKFSQKGTSVLAVNQLIAAPIFLESLVVFPTLDGRLLVVSTRNFQPQRSIILGTDKVFNNIIYLYGDDTRIFAATGKKIVSIISGQEFSHNGEFIDVLFDGKYIYALNLEGKISQFDHTMREVNSVKLPFATLEGIVIINNHLYTFEKRGGYIISLDLDDFKYKVYKTQDAFGKLARNKLSFYSKNIFYYDRHYFDFSRFEK